jgi:cathepsin L
MKSYSSVLILVSMCWTLRAAAQQPIDYAKRELKASPEIKNVLVDLRAQKTTKKWTFDVVYTSALDKSLVQLTGLRRMANFKQFVIARNLKAKEDLKKLKKPHVAPPGCVAGDRSFDWRTRNGVTPIKNQDPCGSCWDFAAHAVLESSWLINNKQLINSSEQSTLDCLGSSDNCGGGHPSDACNYLQSTGSASTFNYPYTAVQGGCENAGDPYKLYTWGYVGDDDNIPSVNQIKEAICFYGPVGSEVYADHAMQSYGGGVFNEHATDDINHVVSIIGWDDDKQAWLVKNSWGTDWGNSCGYGTSGGYMWISYNSNSIGHGAFWVLAQEVEVSDHHDTLQYSIPEPIVNRSLCTYDGQNTAPAILFQPGDIVSVTAGGCAQTGGAGKTWKRYVDPEGDNSDHEYYGLIQIAGVTNGLVPLRNTGGSYAPGQPDRYTVHFKTAVPDNIPESERYLKLGYTDDDYSDNGYYSHDNGNDNQCASCGNAYVIITIVRKKK